MYTTNRIYSSRCNTTKKSISDHEYGSIKIHNLNPSRINTEQSIKEQQNNIESCDICGIRLSKEK